MSKEARLLFGRLANRRPVWGRALALAAIFLFGATADSWAATYQTRNFIINADSSDFARRAGEAAETWRRELAQLWLGEEMLPWSKPCVVTIKTGPTLGAGGETIFTVCGNEVYDWKIKATGSEERVLDSVLPHEITHTILASYLRAQAPRWLDEGMATSVEADGERTNYRLSLADFLHSRKGIAFNDMVAMKEYPAEVMPFYSQAFSVCEYLILIGGRRRLVEFAKEGATTNDWNAALRRYYEGRTLGDLQVEWLAWVEKWDKANRPAQLPETPKLRDFDEWRREEMLASRGAVPTQARDLDPTARAQNFEATEKPLNWKERFGEVFDGVRSWGGGSENKQKSEDLTLNERKERVEPTSAEVWEDSRTDRNRRLGATRQVAPNRPDAQVRTTAPSVAPIWIPRANESASSTASQPRRTGVLTSGAGSASRSTAF